MHEEAIEDYDELMHLDPDARCAAVELRSGNIGLGRFDGVLSK